MIPNIRRNIWYEKLLTAMLHLILLLVLIIVLIRDYQIKCLSYLYIPWRLKYRMNACCVCYSCHFVIFQLRFHVGQTSVFPFTILFGIIVFKLFKIITVYLHRRCTRSGVKGEKLVRTTPGQIYVCMQITVVTKERLRIPI